MRRRFDAACAQIRTIRALFDVIRPFLTFRLTLTQSLVALVIVLLLLGLFLGIGYALFMALALVLVIGVAIFGLAWLLSLVLGKLAEAPARSLADALVAFQKAAEEVRKHCPMQCQGNLTPPEC